MNAIKIGKKIQILYVPGDNAPYLKDDIFVEPGNFVFDFVLLFGELALAFGYIMELVKRRLPSGSAG